MAQLEIREYLAKAMGWKKYPDRRKLWQDPNGIQHHEMPDSFRSSSDLLELVEWTRKQKWFHSVGFDDKSVWITLDVDVIVEGPFQEAFPLVVYQALQEVKKS